MINTIRTLNSTFIDVQHELLTLLTTRKFLLTHAETLIHSHRLRVVVETLKQDVNKFEQYLVMLSLGKLNPALISPKLLSRCELPYFSSNSNWSTDTSWFVWFCWYFRLFLEHNCLYGLWMPQTSIVGCSIRSTYCLLCMISIQGIWSAHSTFNHNLELL